MKRLRKKGRNSMTEMVGEQNAADTWGKGW